MKRILAVTLAVLFVAVCFISVAAAQKSPKGDINMNGEIDMTDYILAKRAYFGTYALNDEELVCADINMNNGIDMTDYILIKRMYFGTYSLLEVSEPENSETELSVPEASEPEISEPELSVPETSEPETSNPEVDETPETEVKWDDDGALKVLAIGNSFSIDSLQYVYQIAENIGVEKIVVGNLYIGGCSIDTHVDNIVNDKPAYDYYYNKTGVWQHTANYRISAAVVEENWDYITLQQVSGYSGVPSSYENLTTLISEVKKLCADDTKLAWNMTWAYQQGSTHGDFAKYSNDQITMYNAIVSTAQEQILTNDNFALVIPTGTAIQNARTSFVGDTLTRDGYHLTLDLGRYIAGVAVVHALTGLPIDNLIYAPSGVADSIYNEAYISLAIESAKNAVISPYAVTKSEITEVTSADFGNYQAIDLGLTAHSFYYSLSGKALNSTADNSHQFYATRIFTKDEIPVGSIIVIQSGWKYRPEGWESTGTRPDEVSTEMVTVTEEWWGSYTERAFNISKVTGEALDNYATEASNALKIYIPKE